MDIRWALLPAMLFATIAIMVFWSENEYTVDSHYIFGCVIVPLVTITFLIVAMWVIVKKKVTYSFCLLMTTFFLLNGALVVDTLDAVYATKRIYKIQSSNENIGETSLEIKYRSTWLLHNMVDSMWESMISKLENEGIDDIAEYGYDEQYYRNQCHDTGIVAIGIASFLLVFYFIYAVIAHKRGWTF